MKPYYEDSFVTLYHGDCRDFLDLSTDTVLVTDPPYGVELGTGDQRTGTSRLGRVAYASYTDTYADYLGVVVPMLTLHVTRAKRAAVFVGPHYHELPKADAIGGVFCPAATGRNQWGFKTFLPVLLYGVAPNLNLGSRPTAFASNSHVVKNGHPCPKPIEWMRWLVDLATETTDIVFDPFAGSGTTLRAAKDLGRKAIGVEIDERYCEIAARRCSQEVLDLGATA